MTVRAAGGIAVAVCALGLVFSACGSSDDGGGDASDAGTDGKVIQCVVPSDCDDKNPCSLDDCVDNTCEHELAPDGDALVQEEGDCKKTVCKLGTPELLVDNGDVPDDDEPCTLDVCTVGVPQNTPVLEGSKCTIGNGNGQCKAGVCWILCTSQNQHIQCDDLNSCTEDACLPCDKPECEGKGVCSHQGLSGIPTPGAPQSDGDCKERRCVEGEDEEVEDNFDVPDDGIECTTDLCKSGEPGHLPEPLGTTCGGSSYKCDANGDCVQCLSVADCDDYTPGDCSVVACTEGSCTLEPKPAGTVCGPSGEVCGPNGSCCESCASLGNACGTLSNGCGETLNCGTCPSGQVCYSNSCCTPQQCTAGECGTQSDGCGGTITCPSCPSGQVCYSQSCCVPKTCTAGSCGTQSDGCGGSITCGSCAPGDSCSSGTCGCANGVKNTAETDVDCGGVCTAKCAQGLKCLAGSDCTTGNCVDGVCCNAPCSGTCQACTATLTGQTTGICASVTDGTDPGAECTATSSTSCGTTGVCKAGACEYHPAGTQCGSASCSGNVQYAADTCNGSGSCVPGSQTTCPAPYVCGATSCQSCSDGVKNGNEWGTDCGTSGCPGCPNGTACTSGAQCASGQCIDGYCCNTSCGALCMACNVSGNQGTCSPVPFGQDPLSECAGQKTCNGAGGCT